MARPNLDIEVYEESAIEPELSQEIGQHLYDCFSWRQAINDRTRTWYGQKPEYTVIGRVNGILIAHTAIVERRYLTKDQCPNGQFPTDPAVIAQAQIGAGIQGVSVAESYRRHRYGMEILTAAMMQAIDAGYPIAILHAPHSLDAFYSLLGWRWDNDVAFILDAWNKPAHTQPGNCCMTADLR